MKVFFGPSYHRAVDVPHHLAVLHLFKVAAERNLALKIEPTWGDALIERSRARSATRFLESTDCDVWLSIDSDIHFHPDDALRLCEQALQYDVVGGLYMTRTSHDPIPAVRLEQGRRYDLSDSTPVPVTYPSTGYLAVHRRVFEHLAKDLPVCHPTDSVLRHIPFFTPFPKEEGGELVLLSEDWALVARAREAGFGIYLNPAVRATHFGMLAVSTDDLAVERTGRTAQAITRTGEGAYAVERQTAQRQAAPLNGRTPVLAGTRGGN